MRIFVFKKNSVIRIAICAAILIGAAAFVISAVAKNTAPAFGESSENVLTSIKTDQRTVALTIDTAFDNDKTKEILDFLKEKNIKATFAVMGLWAEANHDLVNAMKNDGHQIISHSMGHISYLKSDDASILSDAKTAQQMLKQEFGINTKYIRPPYGTISDPQAKLLISSGFIPVTWSLDMADWKGDGIQATSDRLMSGLNGGDIILMQNNTDDGIGALKKAVDSITGAGYRFVTLDELIAES